MARQQKVLFPKLNPGYSHFQLPGSSHLLLNRRGEEKPAHRVFRTKRKHVQRACERCRVKKSKCDGNQPCSRCITYNQACVFRDRKATQEKVYSRGFVEMLISQHAVHLQALRDLYKRCVTGEGFPGSPLQESTQGYPGTHAILDRLGLIKHAEEAIEDPQKVLADMVDYLNCLETHSDCLDSTESTDTSEATLSGNPSPEFSTPMELADSTMPSVACTWIETSDHHQLYHAHDGSKPLQQQQQQYPDISPAGNSDDACAIGNNADPSEVPWHYCAPQLRYIPPAGIDAGCERTDLSINVSWTSMTTDLSPLSYVPISSRSDDSEESIYANDQPVFPGIQAYAHHFGNNGALQRERQRQFRQSGDPVLLNVSTEDHCVYL